MTVCYLFSITQREKFNFPLSIFHSLIEIPYWLLSLSNEILHIEYWLSWEKISFSSIGYEKPVLSLISSRKEDILYSEMLFRALVPIANIYDDLGEKLIFYINQHIFSRKIFSCIQIKYFFRLRSSTNFLISSERWDMMSSAFTTFWNLNKFLC